MRLSLLFFIIRVSVFAGLCHSAGRLTSETSWVAGVEIALGMTGGDGGEGTGCGGRASSDEESVSLSITDVRKYFTSDGTLWQSMSSHSKMCFEVESQQTLWCSRKSWLLLRPNSSYKLWSCCAWRRGGLNHGQWCNQLGGTLRLGLLPSCCGCDWQYDVHSA